MTLLYKDIGPYVPTQFELENQFIYGVFCVFI